MNEATALKVLAAILDEIGIDGFIKLVSKLAGGGDRVQAILDAEYASNDVAADLLEQDKLAKKP